MASISAPVSGRNNTFTGRFGPFAGVTEMTTISGAATTPMIDSCLVAFLTEMMDSCDSFSGGLPGLLKQTDPKCPSLWHLLHSFS